MPKTIRRINFYGGPGSGKSRLAAKVFSSLVDYNVAHVTEWIKKWAIQGIKPESEDQLFVFANQVHEEDLLLRKVDFIVTDSPIFLNVCYSSFYGYEGSESLIKLAKNFDAKYKPLNFYINRTVPFEQFGRYQDFNQSIEFDNYLLNFINKHVDGENHIIDVNNFDAIIDLIKEKLNEC